MRHQIRVLEAPTRWGTGAFAPTPAQSSTAEFHGQNQAGITGAPGTVPIYSPRPAALSDGELGGPLNQPSSVAPNWFLPSIYFYRPNRTQHFPGDINTPFFYISPVPATAIGAVVNNGWRRPVIGGDRVTRALRPFTQWQSY